jgi:hypothetical protein
MNSLTKQFAWLLNLILAASPMLAQSQWSKVPALPQACYRGQDTFERDAQALKTQLESDIERQKTINRGIMDQVFKADPATLQQRMMAAVQKNPEKSQEIIQAMQSLGTPASQGSATEAGTEGADFHARKTRARDEYIEESKKVLGRSYAAAVAAPAQTRNTAWGEYNRQYETVTCERWFRKQIPDLLTEYRTYLVEQRIPKQQAGDAKPVPMLEMLGVSAKEFRSVAEMRGVVDYLGLALDLYTMRSNTPGPPN